MAFMKMDPSEPNQGRMPTSAPFRTTISGPGANMWHWHMKTAKKIPMSFYTNMPADAKCIFSLNDEVKTKRPLYHLIPRRDAVEWSDAQVQRKARSIRAQYPEATKHMDLPELWIDLYKYFDATDLWFHGIWNLQRVIARLCHENEETAQGKKPTSTTNSRPGHQDEASLQGNYDPALVAEVDDWVYKWLTHDENRRKLSLWDQKSDILTVFDREDESLVDNCDARAMGVLREALRHWHQEYYSLSPVKRRAPSTVTAPQPLNRHPSLFVWNCASEPFTYDPYRRLLSVPQPSRPRGSSASLQPTTPADMPRSNLSTSNSPYAAKSGPRTVSGPVIVNGTVFSRWTPEQALRRASENQKRAAMKDAPKETCDHPAVEQEQGKKGHHPSKSGPVPMDHEFRSAGEGVEKAGPSRLPRIASHNPNGLSVPPAVVEPTEPVAATAQNSESSQPDKARHSAEEPKVLETQTALSCQTSAAPTEKDRQPNGNSHSHSHSHGHEHEHKHKPTASVETITSGWSTTRHDDLHGPVMQHRISVRKSSGPGTAAPKSTVAAHDFPKGSAADHEGQENSSPSQDVSTSDIASQKVPETSGSGQEARKNSLPHGHEPRTSTAGQYTQPPRVPFSPTSMVACKNIDKRMHDPFYEECPCLRCVESSRTVFVTIRDDSNMPKLDPQARLDAIGHCFGRWGRVEMVQPRRQQDWSKDFFNVYVRFSTENSALEAIKAANMQPGPALRIPLVTNRLLAWFPYYSKHFRPKPSRFHGRHSMSFQIPQARPGREAAASQPPFRNSSTGSVYEAQMQQQHGLQPRPQPLLQQTVQEHPVHQQHIAQQPVPQQPVKQQSPFQQQHVQQEHIQQQQATQEQQIQHHQPVQQQQRQSVQQQHIQHHQHAQQQHYKRQHNQHHQSVQKQQQPVQEQHTQHHQPAQQQQSVQKQQYMQKQQQQQKQPGNKQPQHGRKVTNRMSQHHANPQAPPYTPGLQSPAIVYRRRDSLPPPFPSATGQPHPFTDVPPFMGGNTGSVDNLDMMQPGQVPPGQFYPLAYPPPPQPPPFPVGYTHAPPPGMPFVPVAGPPGQPIQPGLQPGQPGQPGHPGQPVQVVPHAQFYPGAVPFYPQMPVFPHGGVVYTPISYPYFPPGVNGTPAGHLVPVDHQPYQQQGHFPTPPGQQDGQTAQHHRLPPPQIQPFTMTPRMAVSQPLTRNFSDWAPDGKPIREFPLETPTRSGPPKGPRLVHQASGAKASTSAVNATTQKMASSSSDLAPQEAGQDQELDVEDHGTAIRRKPRQNPGLPAQWVDRGYSAGPSDQATRETSPEAFGPQTQPQDGPSQSVEKKKSKHKSKKKKNQNSNQSSSNSCAAIAPLGHPQAAQDKGKEAETALDVATGAGFDNNRKDRSQTVASRPTNPATLDSGSRTQKDKGLKAASKSDAKPKGNEEGIRVSASRPSTPSDSVDNFQPVQSHEADAKNDTTPKATAQVVGKDTDNDATPKAPAQVVRHDTGDDGALEAPAQVPDQSQPKKKGKNNKSKRGTKAGNDPSVTAEKAADQPSNEPLQSLDSRDTSPDRKQNPQLSVDQPYRAEAGGSLRIRRNRSKGPTLKSAFATSEPMAKDSEDKELPVEAAECPVAANKEVTLRDQNIHGSFKNLPKQFNAWPRQGDGKIWVPPPLAAQSKVTTPKVVVEHVETVKQRDTSTATDSDGLQLCSRKPSASSATLSHRTSDYFSTKSSFSRENTPPAADELKFESPLASPERSAPSPSSSPKDLPRTPSSTTMTHIPSPVDVASSESGSPANSVASSRPQSASTTPQRRAESQNSSPVGSRR